MRHAVESHFGSPDQSSPALLSRWAAVDSQRQSGVSLATIQRAEAARRESRHDFSPMHLQFAVYLKRLE